MTSAARPTWAPAKGGTRIFGPSHNYSSRDIASHTSLKPRKNGQDSRDEIQIRNLRDELEERERKHFASKDKEDRDHRKRNQLLLEVGNRLSIDADKVDHVDANEDGDEDEDDTEALLAELEQIKKERNQEKIRKEQEEREEELKAKESEMLLGNPLLNNNSVCFGVKRRWDDDVVFKNQARDEVKVQKRFINDTIRSDFHRKFLHKYMK